MVKHVLVSIFIVLQAGLSGSGSTQNTLTQVYSANSWQIPFGEPHKLMRHYLQPTSDYSAGHRGVDYSVQIGDEVRAPADGVILFQRHLVDRDVITVAHASGITSEFEPACGLLPSGSSVRRGQPIGSVCSPDSGYSWHCQTETCLHFSVRLNGKYLSPLAFIGGLNPSRLLPYARG